MLRSLCTALACLLISVHTGLAQATNASGAPPKAPTLTFQQWEYAYAEYSSKTDELRFVPPTGKEISTYWTNGDSARAFLQRIADPKLGAAHWEVGRSSYFTAILTTLGAQGWELVTALQTQDPTFGLTTSFILKRPRRN